MTQPPTIMPTIIRGQTSNSSSIGIPIAHSIRLLLSCPPGVCMALSPICYLVQLHQLADHLVLAAVADAGGDAGVEVALQDHRLHLLDGTAGSGGLLGDVRAVLVVLDHASDACQVALDVVEALEDALSGGVFHVSSVLPLRRPGTAPAMPGTPSCNPGSRSETCARRGRRPRPGPPPPPYRTRNRGPGARYGVFAHPPAKEPGP